MNLTLLVVLEVILMTASFAGGFVLAGGGMPYNQLLFNLHKFLVLGNVFLLNYWTVSFLKGGDSRVSVIVMLVILNIFFLLAMISGGIQNLDNLPGREVVHIVHKVIPWFALASTGGLIVLLSRNYAQ